MPLFRGQKMMLKFTKLCKGQMNDKKTVIASHLIISSRNSRLVIVKTSTGDTKSPLDGQLIAIKDNICTTDQPTTCASKILNNFLSPITATVIEKLQTAGAVMVGKTNLDEFGMG